MRGSGVASIFGDSGNPGETFFDRIWEETTGRQAEAAGPYPVNVDEDDQHVYVEAELPGFTREDVDLSLQSGVLLLHGERKIATSERTSHLSERRFTKVDRRIVLPAAVDEETVDAHFQDGVLFVTFKKSEGDRRRINVR